MEHHGVNMRLLVLILFLWTVKVSSFACHQEIRFYGRQSTISLAMASTVHTIEVPITNLEIQLGHQLFLGDLQTSDHDLTDLKFWPTASQPMLVELGKRYHSKPLRILELGSGCGLLGIGLAAMAHTVFLTDADVNFSDDTITSSTLEWLQSNVELNHNVIGDRATVHPLLWGDANDMDTIPHEFDLIVGSELLYTE